MVKRTVDEEVRCFVCSMIKIYSDIKLFDKNLLLESVTRSKLRCFIFLNIYTSSNIIMMESQIKSSSFLS